MTIVVLDGFTLNPGDLSWQALQKLGECKIYERTPANKIVSRASHAEIVLTNKTPLSRETIASLPSLRYIGVLATGHNIIDCDAARERRIPVSNIPTYGTSSVAQMVFAHLLNLTQHVAHHAGTVRAGRWTASADFCYWDLPLVELEGLTLGVVGFGRIGQAAARLAEAFGMEVISHDRDESQVSVQGYQPVSLEDLFRQSDVVTLHCPLTPETEAMVNKERLGMMKTTAFLINTSRGPLIDEHALARALESGRIAGAGLDVLSTEPPHPDNPLLTAPRCFITPHIAWATRAARQRLLSTALENVRSFLDGKPANVVNQ